MLYLTFNEVLKIQTCGQLNTLASQHKFFILSYELCQSEVFIYNKNLEL